MKHFHLDIHVNKHLISTVILSSITVICITAIEYVHLNTALAYEKNSIIEQYIIHSEKDKKNSPNILEKESTYSDEIQFWLYSAIEIPKEAEEQKNIMKKSLKKLIQKKQGNNLLEKLTNLNSEKRAILLKRINEKIQNLQNSWITEVEKYNKRLGYLLGVRETFFKQ